MKTILFPTDFSTNANQAFLFALKCADKLDAELRIFHSYKIPVFDTTIPPSVVETLIEEEDKDSHEKMTDLIHRNPDPEVTALLKKIKINITIAKGFVVEGIVDEAKAFPTDLIVMGTKGATGLSAALIGSNTASIMEHVSIPVLAVPEDARYEGFNKIAFASNLSEDEFAAMEFFVQLADAFGSEMHIFHVSPNDDPDELYKVEFFKRKLGDRWDISRFKFVTLEQKDVENGLHYLVVNEKIDLLAMLAHHHGFFRRIFATGLTKKMAYHTHVPLLAFHAEKAAK